jgi:hypothetical protein
MGTEAALLLVIFHYIYAFSLGAEQLTVLFNGQGYRRHQQVQAVSVSISPGISDNMLIRFKPFLIGFYMYVRFRSNNRLFNVDNQLIPARCHLSSVF